jgi:hypothetical protein
MVWNSIPDCAGVTGHTSVSRPKRASQVSISSWLTSTRGASLGVSPPASGAAACRARAVSASTHSPANSETSARESTPVGKPK